jgi:hypothetical protein
MVMGAFYLGAVVLLVDYHSEAGENKGGMHHLVAYAP